ncbi:MAG: OBG GTPase family GTP-binding protein [Archaeoglobaceae archaeon]
MSTSEQIKELEEEIKNTPYNKATERHIGRLKAKLARLRESEEKKKSKSGVTYSVKKEGDATVVLVGFPSVGKSTLLNQLTGARSEVAHYDFTTLQPIPGMLDYKGARIQLVDAPGVIEGASKGRGRGKEVISTVRAADLILIVTDIFNMEHVDIIKNELYDAGIRLNQPPPQLMIRKKEKGGIKITSTSPLSIDEQTIIEILKEYKIHNADVVLREDATVDKLIDAVLKNRVYIPSLTAVNKIDLGEMDKIDRGEMDVKGEDIIPISDGKRINLNALVQEIYNKLDFIRVYLKPPSQKPDYEEPLIVKKGSTIEDVCKKLHKDMYRNFKYAKVWGSSKFDGQRVSIEHVLEDEDVLTIYTS